MIGLNSKASVVSAYKSMVFVAGILAFVTPLKAQQVPSWRIPVSTSNAASKSSVRIEIKPSVQVSSNVLMLSDVAELSGEEPKVRVLSEVPLGPSPSMSSSQSWTREDLLNVLRLRGISTDTLRWAGVERCVVSSTDSQEISKRSLFNKDGMTPQMAAQAQRNVANVILNYLQTKDQTTTFWTVEPKIPEQSTKLLANRANIIGVAGGEAPWLGSQKFILLVRTLEGEQTIEVITDVSVPPLVAAATGPLSKGRIISDKDLKLIRLTPSMKASFEDCYVELETLIGKELRRNISTGQPILRSDTGPPRVINAKDPVKLRVIAGIIVAETDARAIQSGGIDDVIEVELPDTKKRIASRVVAAGSVEAIAR